MNAYEALMSIPNLNTYTARTSTDMLNAATLAHNINAGDLESPDGSFDVGKTWLATETGQFPKYVDSPVVYQVDESGEEVDRGNDRPGDIYLVPNAAFGKYLVVEIANDRLDRDRVYENLVARLSRLKLAAQTDMGSDRAVRTAGHLMDAVCDVREYDIWDLLLREAANAIADGESRLRSCNEDQHLAALEMDRD